MSETNPYKHLVIIIDKDMALNEIAKEARNKMKSTFLSLVNCGLLLSVALWIILRSDLFYVLACVILFCGFQSF